MFAALAFLVMKSMRTEFPDGILIAPHREISYLHTIKNSRAFTWDAAPSIKPILGILRGRMAISGTKPSPGRTPGGDEREAKVESEKIALNRCKY